MMYYNLTGKTLINIQLELAKKRDMSQREEIESIETFIEHP